MSDRFDDVQRWVRALDDGSKARPGFGYEIEWTEINHRQLGRNRLPTGARIDTEKDALRLIGTQAEAPPGAAQLRIVDAGKSASGNSSTGKEK